MAYDIQRYLRDRGDLANNWQRANDPAWLQQNPGDRDLVNWILSFGSLDNYALNDLQGNAQANNYMAQPPPAQPQPAPQPPPAVNPLPTVPSLPLSPGTYTPTGPTPQNTPLPPPVTVTQPPPQPQQQPEPVTQPPPQQPPPANPFNIPQVPTANNTDPTAHERNITGEGAATLQAMVNLAPSMYQAYQTYAPAYAATDVNILGQSLFGSGYTGNLTDINRRLTQEAITQSNQGNRAVREANIADMAEFGGQALQSIYNLNTPLYQNMDILDATARRGLGSNGQAPRTGYQNALREQFLQGPSFQSVQSQQVTPSSVTTGSIANPLAPRTVNAAQSDIGLQTATGQLGSLGPGSLQRTLEQQAANDLALGRGLSEAERRDAQQAAREAWSARGLINSTGAVADEVLNTDRMARQREAERRAFAQQVDQSGFGQRQAAFANALGLSDASRGYAGLGLQADMANQGRDLSFNDQLYRTGLSNQQLGLQAQLANQQAGLTAGQTNAANALQAALANQQTSQQALGMNQSLGMDLSRMEIGQDQQAFQNLLSQTQQRAATAFNPFSVLGDSANQGMNASLFGMTGPATANSQNVYNQFNPFNAYASDLYNTNYNAVEAARLNAANASAGKRSGWMQLGGSLLGAAGAAGGFAALLCWVAREVYGETNPRWLHFREWVLTQAPAEFREFYRAHGRLVAGLLRLRPQDKPALREWMDAQIATLNAV